jgi:hypothetical protein
MEEQGLNSAHEDGFGWGSGSSGGVKKYAIVKAAWAEGNQEASCSSMNSGCSVLAADPIHPLAAGC